MRRPLIDYLYQSPKSSSDDGGAPRNSELFNLDYSFSAQLSNVNLTFVMAHDNYLNEFDTYLTSPRIF